MVPGRGADREGKETSPGPAWGGRRISETPWCICLGCAPTSPQRAPPWTAGVHPGPAWSGGSHGERSSRLLRDIAEVRALRIAIMPRQTRRAEATMACNESAIAPPSFEITKPDSGTRGKRMDRLGHSGGESEQRKRRGHSRRFDPREKDLRQFHPAGVFPRGTPRKTC